MLVDLFCIKSINMNISKIIFLALALSLANSVAAASTAADSTENRLKKVEDALSKLSNLKISGYMQPQFQVADSMGISTPAGGNFANNSDKRFGVRRGRVKFTYNPGSTLFVIQLDATEKGVGVKDAYLQITDPWVKSFNLTAGMFLRPFGHELEYSSSKRESPERGRMSSIIFPGERDLGAMLSFNPSKDSKLGFLSANLAVINGTGPSASDFDVQKDIVGRVKLSGACMDGKWNYSGGVSVYEGGWRTATDNVYNVNIINGIKQFTVDSTSTKKGSIVSRSYQGVNFETTYQSIIGKTSLRAEYITGTQPASSASANSPTGQPTSDAYNRSFDGLYAYFIQDIGKSKHALVLKYDWFDPNTDVSGNEIGATGSNLNSADIRFETIGFGYVYNWDANVKMTAYYDMATNENTKLNGFTKDISDNVFTLRLQYKF